MTKHGSCIIQEGSIEPLSDGVNLWTVRDVYGMSYVLTVHEFRKEARG